MEQNLRQNLNNCSCGGYNGYKTQNQYATGVKTRQLNLQWQQLLYCVSN